MRPRSLSAVPVAIKLLLVVALLAQLAWHAARSRMPEQTSTLSPPPSVAVLSVASMGETIWLAKALMLWLQSFDVQEGTVISFRHLDYQPLTAWLQRVLDLDPRGQYPLMAAARVYTLVPDRHKQEQMLEWIYREFPRDPERRWPWMAHAAILAKHRLGDLGLALKYSQIISDISDDTVIPGWARQMNIFMLQEVGDLAAAEMALRALLDSGTVTNPAEQRFLEAELRKTREKIATQGQ